MPSNNEQKIDTLIYAIHELFCGEIEYSRLLTALNDQGIPAYTNGINKSNTNLPDQPIAIHPLFYTRSIPHLALAHDRFASKLNTNRLSSFLTNSHKSYPLINLIKLIESVAVRFIDLVNETCVFYTEYSAGFHIAIKFWQAVVHYPDLSKDIACQLATHQVKCLVCDHIDDNAGQEKHALIDFDSLLNAPVQRLTRYALLWTSIQKAWIEFANSSQLFNCNDPTDFSSVDKTVGLCIDQAIFMSNQLAVFVDRNRDVYDKLCRSYLFWYFASPPPLTKDNKPTHMKIDSKRTHTRAKSMDSSTSQQQTFTNPFIHCHIESNHWLDALHPDSNMIISGLTDQYRNKALDSIYQWWNQDRSTCPDLIHADHTKMLNADSLSLIISTGMYLDQSSTGPQTVQQQTTALSSNTLPPPLPPKKSPVVELVTVPPPMHTYYAFLLFNDGTLVAAEPNTQKAPGPTRSDSFTSLDQLVSSSTSISQNVLSVKYHIKYVWQLFGLDKWNVHELVNQQPADHSRKYFGLRLQHNQCVLDMYSCSPHVRAAWISALQTLFRSSFVPQDLNPMCLLMKHLPHHIPALVLKPGSPYPSTPIHSEFTTTPSESSVLEEPHSSGTLRPRSLVVEEEPEASIEPTPFRRKTITTSSTKPALNLWSEFTRVVSRRSRSSSVVATVVRSKATSLDDAFANIFSYIPGQNNIIPRSYSSTSIRHQHQSPPTTDSGNCTPPTQPRTFPANSSPGLVLGTTSEHDSATQPDVSVPSSEYLPCTIQRCKSCTALDKQVKLVSDLPSIPLLSPQEGHDVPDQQPISPTLSPLELITYKIATKVKRVPFIAF